MKNFVQDGNIVTVKAAAITLSGQLTNLDKLVGVAITDAAVDEEFEMALTGVYELPVKSGVTIVEGEAIYLIEAESVVTNISTGNIACGFALTGGTDVIEGLLR